MSLQSIALKDAPGWLYPFTDTSGTQLTDVSGNANHGTLVGSPTLGQRSLLWGPWEGKSMLFDGSTQYVSTIPAGVVTTTTYTYEFLHRPETVSGVQCLAHDGTNGIFINNGKLSFYYGATYHDASTTLVAGTEYLLHVVVTAGAVEFRVDRELDGTASGAPVFSATTLYAQSDGSNKLNVTGCIAACYPGKALGRAEIHRRYRWAMAVGMRKLIGNLSPYGLWPMGERSGSVGYDVSGNDNDGTYSDVTLAQTHQVRGQNGGSVLFDGAAGHLVIPDATAIQNVFDGGGCAGIVLNATSDGESDAGRVMDKGAWSIAVTSEAGGAAKITFTQQFSTTNGVWETTSADLTLAADDTLIVDYDNSATTNDPVIYVSGAAVALTESSTPVGTRTTDVGSDLYIGNYAAGSATFDGRMSWSFLAPSIASYRALQFNQARRSRFAAEAISHQPKHYWRRNEASGTTLIDYGSAADDATVNGGPAMGSTTSPMQDEPGHTSILYDGVDDYESDFLPTLSGNNVTVVDFVRVSEADTTLRYLLDANPNRFVFAFQTDTSGKMGVYDGAWKSIADAPNDDAWHMISFALQGATARAYIDKDQTGADTAITPINWASATLAKMGRNYNVATAFFKGYRSETAIYEVTLTPAQIYELHDMADTNPLEYVVAGTLTESLDAEDWFANVINMVDGALLDRVPVVGGAYAVSYLASDGDALVTMQADIGARFVPGATYAADDYLYPTVVDDTTHFYKCTVGGVAGAEPGAWNTSGGTSTSGACTFQDMGIIPEFKTQLCQPEEG